MSNLKLGINGFGRIGRLVFRAALKQNIEVVGINDLLEVDHLAYLLKYDSVHGRFDGTIDIKDGQLIVNGKTIRVTSEKDPRNLKWNEVQADVIADCTGIFKTLETAHYHIEAGAKKVVVSAPSKDIPMFV
ncbi:MAG TPA: type I glyceraldehyde-3-phosphate dehydrogenase, partial [Xanthomarina gelatinilytica]|nr:type I glyceraldehyde-3-phosphate dehydrogenase [Xanthomarina gelatinilytica]